ncbi:hypothetical protein EGK_12462 [Macaca mulatta]|uniref:Uncharacterized protein n=2 Tax=Macaca TaxID=9539 RepID=G7NPK0_MACMU|nr:hypothetical protein EGK_12462 [Macaca mulatta]EHH60140.1 hypothetical protein EGM_11442 [Macaca fascicularis]
MGPWLSRECSKHLACRPSLTSDEHFLGSALDTETSVFTPASIMVFGAARARGLSGGKRTGPDLPELTDPLRWVWDILEALHISLDRGPWGAWDDAKKQVTQGMSVFSLSAWVGFSKIIICRRKASIYDGIYIYKVATLGWGPSPSQLWPLSQIEPGLEDCRR